MRTKRRCPARSRNDTECEMPMNHVGDLFGFHWARTLFERKRNGG